MQGEHRFADLPVGMAFYKGDSYALVKISNQHGALLLDSRSSDNPFPVISPIPADAEVVVAGVEAF